MMVVKHNVPLGADPGTVAAIMRDAAVALAAANHYDIVGPPAMLVDREAVYVRRDDREGWVPTDDGPGGVGLRYGKPQGRTVVWDVPVEPSAESQPVYGELQDNGTVHVTVPLRTRDRGGVVPAVHRLGTEDVTVTAHRADHSPIGYDFFAPITEDEVEVHTVPGTVLIVVAAVAPTPKP